MTEIPKIENAPGLVLRPRKAGWAATWQARRDLVARGFTPKSRRIAIVGENPSDAERAFIAEQCRALQDEMLIWGRGGLPAAGAFDGTLTSLIRCYQTDEDSPFRKLRYPVRVNYTGLCRRIENDHGDERIADIKTKQVLRWHEDWIAAVAAKGKKSGVVMAHSLVGMLRTVINFGATMLEDDDCERLFAKLHRMRFGQGKPRSECITYDQVVALCASFHAAGLHSLALAQKLQFELTLRQKDVIGEYVPQSEPGISEVLSGNQKWLRGLRWEEIDADLVLHHVTSKRGKVVEPKLTISPLIMEELERLAGGAVERSRLPAKGPVIVSEATGLPYRGWEYRRTFRKHARLVGIPDRVFNMDSRAGAISEALAAGASLDSVRKTATHSDASMTQRYSRGDQEEIAKVQKLRVAGRNKSGTSAA